MTETFPWPVQNVGEWMPLWQAGGFFLATFILEDAAAIGAGLLLAAGTMSWPVAFGSCFLGIWMGDAGLYAMARFGGRKWFEQSRFRKYSNSVERYEEWFARRGNVILIFSRCVPGARLPTYLTAGFLRVPFGQFLMVTAGAALVWTFLVLWLVESLGAEMVRWLQRYEHGSLILAATAIGLLVAFQFLRFKAMGTDLPALAARLERWRHWEFWPPWLFYPPVILYCAWLALKYRGLANPTLANPKIFSGGLVGESKMATLEVLSKTSPDFTAAAALVAGDNFQERQNSLKTISKRLGLALPFILKPDLGQRGDGVKLIQTGDEADNYLRQANVPLIAQQYAPGPCEAGIFYYRFPNQPRGKIFAITEKIFPVVVGDGVHTIAELVERDDRARLIANTYLRRFGARRDEVLPKGQTFRLVEAGNHAQGCIFRDGQRLWTPELEARIDEISQKLDEFYIGRYDIRFASEEDLKAGRNFKIVELNGASAEATSIYDARNSLWRAYRTLFKQWELVFSIGAQNRKRGYAPEKVSAVWKKWREYRRLAAAYPVAD